MNYRKERMQSLLREKLNNLILREVEVSGALVTITDIQITSDLDQATINVSILPKEKEGETFKILEGQRKSLRHMLIKKLNWRLIPELIFRIDSGAENAARVEKILLEEESQGN